MKRTGILVVGLLVVSVAVATPATANHGSAPSDSHCASQPLADEAVCTSTWAAAFALWYAITLAEFPWVDWTIVMALAAVGIVLDKVVCAVFEEPLAQVASCI